MSNHVKYNGMIYRLAAKSVQARPNVTAQLTRMVTTLAQAIEQIENVPSLYRDRERQNESIVSVLGELNSVLVAIEEYRDQLAKAANPG